MCVPQNVYFNPAILKGKCFSMHVHCELALMSCLLHISLIEYEYGTMDYPNDSGDFVYHLSTND